MYVIYILTCLNKFRVQCKKKSHKIWHVSEIFSQFQLLQMTRLLYRGGALTNSVSIQESNTSSCEASSSFMLNMSNTLKI